MAAGPTSTARHIVRPPGFHRIGGRPAAWVDEAGDEVVDAQTIARLTGLRVPPAWSHVWVDYDPAASLQATGVDARGRTQYRYSPEAVERAEGRKFDDVLSFAAALPGLRRRVAADIQPPEPGEAARTLTAAAIRLLDQGLFRVGSDRYAHANHTFGLTTLTRGDVQVDGDTLNFDFVGKEHIRHHIAVTDSPAADVLRMRLTRDDGEDAMLFSTDEPPVPRRVDSATVNSYIHAHTGVAASAKTFRTWGATIAAAAVAGGARPPHEGPRRRSDLAPYQAAADLLGDTLAVARRSYVHPDAVRIGRTSGVQAAVSRAAAQAGSDALEAILRAEALRQAVYEALVSQAGRSSDES